MFPPWLKRVCLVIKRGDEVQKSLKLADLRQQFHSNGVEPVGSSSEQFANTIESDKKKWGEVIRLNDIKAN